MLLGASQRSAVLRRLSKWGNAARRMAIAARVLQFLFGVLDANAVLRYRAVTNRNDLVGMALAKRR